MVSRPRPDRPEEKITDLLDRIQRLETMVYGRSSSVTNGRTRFIGDESLIVIGSQLVSGLLRVIGRLTIEGLGILTVNGLIELFGNMRVRAGGDVTLDGGEVRAGDVTIRQDEIEVGGGESPATLRDGALEFATGGRVEADVANGGARLREGDAVVNVGNVASIRKGDTSVIVGPLGVTVNAPEDQEILLQGATRVTQPATFSSSVDFDGLVPAPAGVETVPLVYAPATGRVYRG